MTVRITKTEFNLREKLSELDKPTGVKGNELMRTNTSQEVRDIVHADRKNIIINGAMQVAQRATTQTGITANGYYTCDRWHLQLNGPTVKLEQDSDNPGQDYGFTKSLALTVTSAVGSISAGNALKLRYLVEGYDVAGLHYGTSYAKSFTLSFWVKSSLTGQFAMSFQHGSRIVNRQVTVHADNTWEHKSVTIIGDYSTALSDTTNGTGLIINIFPSSGSNSTDGANVKEWTTYHNAHTAYGANMGHLTTTNSYFKITGVQMEIGDQHTDFEHRRFGDELKLCQRYFSIYHPCTQEWIYFESATSNHKWWQTYVPTGMRNEPSVTLKGSCSTNNFSASGGTISGLSVQAIDNGGNSGTTHLGSMGRVSYRVAFSGSHGNAYEVRHADGWGNGVGWIEHDSEL